MVQHILASRRLATAAGLTLLLVSAIAGCGQVKDMRPKGESLHLQELVWKVRPAAAENPQQFQALFADGATAPEADLAKYAKLTFNAVSENIQGYTATVTVAVEDDRENDLGTVEWTAVRVGAEWKLKTVSLPPNI